MQAWAATNGFAEAPYEAPSSVVRFSPPADDPISLIRTARQTLNIRASALVTELAPRVSGFLEPFDASFHHRGGGGRTLDQVSAKLDTGTVVGIKMRPRRSSKRDMPSPHATTHWNSRR